MYFKKYPTILVLVVVCLFAFPVKGQEEAVKEPASTPPGSAAIPQEPTALPSETSASFAPVLVKDQMLEGEFELLQEPTIESASKREESVFASPFSSDVITRDMIQKSGARTIPEALRLLPGVIVREQTSGNFDIHIRGLDNMPPGALMHDFICTTMLVMIDYRVVYNYLMGGTFWEALPVDIVDVERIELVRGPAAALYGPNAATGVINIITRKFTTDGLQASARAEGAFSKGEHGWEELGQRILSGRVGYKYNSLSGGLSANYHSFDRLESGLYSYGLQQRVPREELVTPFGLSILGTKPNTPISEPKVAYPEPNLAQRSVGFNGFTTYEPNEKLSFILTGGYQESRSLGEFGDLPLLYSPFTTNDSQSWYLDLRSRFYNFTFEASSMSGHTIVPTGKTKLLDGSSREFYEYKYNTLDLNIDYDFVWKWLRVRPGASFRRAEYSGLPFATWESTWDSSTSSETWRIVGETKALQSASVSVGLEQALWKRLRFIEAVRLDVYFDRTEHKYYPVGATDIDSPTTKRGQILYPSVQLAVTYTPAEDHILRLTYGHANKSPSMTESFYNDPSIQVNGNKALNLLTLDTVELGYRSRFGKQFDLSIEVFGTYARDFTNSFQHGYDVAKLKAIELFDNYDLKAYQVGATVSFGFTARHFQGRAFATIQQTRIEDFDASIFRLYDIFHDPKDPTRIDEPHVGTPDVFGGFYVNYQPADKWNINVNAYYFSQHTQIHSDIPHGDILNNPTYIPDQGRVKIQQSFLLNAKVSYTFWDGLAAFVNARNLLNINQEQFIWGDSNHILCFVGLQYEL